jgi:hypothetical protein
MCTAVLIGWDPATHFPPHLGSYTRVLLVSQDETPWVTPKILKDIIVLYRGRVNLILSQVLFIVGEGEGGVRWGNQRWGKGGKSKRSQRLEYRT